MSISECINTLFLSVVLMMLSFNTNAEAFEGKVLLKCTKNSEVELRDSDLAVNDASLNDPDTKIERIDIEPLIIYEKHRDYRAGSKTLMKSCGPFRIKISGGYYNSNMQGQGGGDSDYPVVQVFFNESVLIKAINIGICEENFCPDKWAHNVVITSTKDGKADVRYDTEYTDEK